MGTVSVYEMVTNKGSSWMSLGTQRLHCNSVVNQLLMAVVTHYHFARGLTGTSGSVSQVLLILGNQRKNRPLRRRGSREIL